MKELTAEEVLENTFNHLNDVLDTKETTDVGHGAPDTPSAQSESDAEADRKKEQQTVVERE